MNTVAKQVFNWNCNNVHKLLLIGITPSLLSSSSPFILCFVCLLLLLLCCCCFYFYFLFYFYFIFLIKNIIIICGCNDTPKHSNNLSSIFQSWYVCVSRLLHSLYCPCLFRWKQTNIARIIESVMRWKSNNHGSVVGLFMVYNVFRRLYLLPTPKKRKNEK